MVSGAEEADEVPGEFFLGEGDLVGSLRGGYAKEKKCLPSLFVFPEEINFCNGGRSVLPDKGLRDEASFFHEACGRNGRLRAIGGIVGQRSVPARLMVEHGKIIPHISVVIKI